MWNVTNISHHGDICVQNGHQLGKFDDFIIMQYTGCYDKNGIEIFEEDIVKSGEIENPIIFDQGAFGWLDIYDCTFYPLCEMTEDFWKNCEVIGNSKENPELDWR